jgi:phosphate starvation-inducible PhoH-like protein
LQWIIASINLVKEILKPNILNELIINIGTVSPAVLWGANNDNFEVFKKAFPKLKVIARGDEVKALGEPKELEQFDKTFKVVLAHVNQFHELSSDALEDLLTRELPASSSKGLTKVNSTKEKNISGGGEPIVFGPNGLTVRAKTPNQRKIVREIEGNDILFAIGPAGTGKTYTAVALAVRALKNREIKRIILTRPAVEAGENLGFLPGDLKEKVDPYLRPLYDALDDMIPPEKLKHYLENRIIEIAPLAFMRGRTLDNCFVILDEAQNATDMQLKMFLTRMGPTAKFIVTGDITQIDLPKKQHSGLKTAVKLLNNIEGISFVYLDGSDVVRHALVKRIIEAYGDI